MIGMIATGKGRGWEGEERFRARKSGREGRARRAPHALPALLAALLFLLAACAAPEGGAPATPATGEAGEPAPSEGVAGVETPPVPPVSEEEIAEAEAEAAGAPGGEGETLDPEVAALVERHEQRVTSLSFHYAPIEVTSAGIAMRMGHEYLVRGGKAKVIINKPKSIDASTYVDTVYLDLATKSARGFCLDPRPYICSAREERLVAYEEYEFTDPRSLLDGVAPNARIVGSRNFQDRVVSILRYERDGTYYELFIDQFTGIPLRQAVYADPEYKEHVGGVEYQELSFNLVTEEDVTPPEVS